MDVHHPRPLSDRPPAALYKCYKTDAGRHDDSFIVWRSRIILHVAYILPKKKQQCVTLFYDLINYYSTFPSYRCSFRCCVYQSSFLIRFYFTLLSSMVYFISSSPAATPTTTSTATDFRRRVFLLLMLVAAFQIGLVSLLSR